MLFDVQAALAEILSEATPPAISAISAIPPPPNSGNSRNSGPPPAEIAPATVLPFAPKPSAPDASDPFRHGRSITGSPLTWTGRIVSLDEWRKLTAWERHGPDGRMFCGACRDWVLPGACPHCGGGAA